jgi:hypothetical protein
VVPDVEDDEFDVLSSGDRVFFSWVNQPEGAILLGVFWGIAVGKYGNEATVLVDGKPHTFPVTAGLSALKTVAPGRRVRIRHIGLRRTRDPLKSYRAFEIAVARVPTTVGSDVRVVI